jgi:hypothetical protein
MEQITNHATTTFCTMIVMTVMTLTMMIAIMTNKNAAAVTVQYSILRYNSQETSYLKQYDRPTITSYNDNLPVMEIKLVTTWL